MNSARSDLFDLSGRVVLLTGSNGHLGRALARGLVQRGATLILNSRSADKVAQQADTLKEAEDRIETAPFDVTNAAARQACMKQIAARHGRLDVLINNAYGVANEDGLESFRGAYETTVVSAYALVQDALELLRCAARRNPHGASVVNIASMYGTVSPDFRIYSQATPPNPPFYGPAKAGLLQLTRYLACQLGPDRIRVNAASPGPFPAPAVQAADPAFIERLGSRNPLGRIGEPDELIGPIVFLASDASSFVTGANLPVDGGWTAW
jgi:NAD(P)-dependent dehydrogenase (short-subunit alcohol dehydrogenase family)